VTDSPLGPRHGPEPPAQGERHRVLVVVGTRPEAIKLAPVALALRDREAEVETRLLVTGQHTDLVRNVLPLFELEPDYDLAIMRPGQSLYDVAGRCLEGMRGILAEFRPHLVLVQGDTATVFFASLATFFEGGDVGHVEAGLRSREKWSPFPEEIFRRLTDVVADQLFAPTPGARDNLLAEGVPEDRIHLTGNTVVDALLTVADRGGVAEDPALRGIIAGPEDLVLLTAHRRESFGEPLKQVFTAILALVDEHPGIHVLYPVHPNPHVRGPAHEMLGGHARISLVEPLSYGDLALALASARLVLTDSGGIQEEAPTFGTPVLVLREVTERPEGIEAGVAQLVGTDPERILQGAREILATTMDRLRGTSENPYGDGRAGERIGDLVISHLTGSPRRTTDWSGPSYQAHSPGPGSPTAD
jgi:UDP-N-acetylglucosamine 2-epimerase (non-hydrolysing)